MNMKRSYSEIAEDVVSAQNGDSAAMDRIIADVQDQVYYTCFRILRSEDAAQDAAQDILLSVFTKLRSLKNAGAYIDWVNRITANTCSERLSKANREILLKEDGEGNDFLAGFEDDDEQSVPDKALDNAETQRMIVELVNTLPDEQRMCVMLFYYDGMKTREIADALDVSEGTVKSRLNYARKALKTGVERLEKEGNIKLHGLSPIPFLAYWLRKAAGEVASPVTAQLIRATAQGMASTAATAASTASTAAALSGGAADTAAAATAGSTATAIGGRILAGILSIGLLAGIGYGIWRSFNSEPPVIPNDIRIGESTPEPSTAPIPTPRRSTGTGETADPDRMTASGNVSDATPAPDAWETHLYGTTYYHGARFTVDQDYRSGDTIRLQYENDETVFAFDGLQFELATGTGRYRSIGDDPDGGIRAGETGTLELTAENAQGVPDALTVRGVVPGETDASAASFRIAFTDAPEKRYVRTDRIAGQIRVSNARFTVNQYYTDNGMGKIELQVNSGADRICFGGSDACTFVLETAKGRYETSVRRIFEPNTNETLILYFDNAEGMPSRLTIGGVSVLDGDGQPTETVEDTVIRFTVGVTPSPVPTPEPDWSAWSLEEPPEDALAVQTRQLYHKKGIYRYTYYFGQFSTDGAETAEAAIDAAIAADLAELEGKGFKKHGNPVSVRSGSDWGSWYKILSVESEFNGWTRWTENNDDLRSPEGLPESPSAGGRLFNFASTDFEFRGEYRYKR